jgi:hypothetical protein
MPVGMQLNVFDASKLSVLLSYVKLLPQMKIMNHGKHATPEQISTSVNPLPKYLEGKIKVST